MLQKQRVENVYNSFTSICSLHFSNWEESYLFIGLGALHSLH